MAQLRLLFDIGVGRRAEESAAALGHDVAAVRDRDPRMPDEEILRQAVLEDRVVVTMDQDFGALVFREGMPRPPGVLLLRLEEESGAAKAAALTALLTQHGDALLGSFAVFQRERLRVRPLREQGP